MRVGHAEPVGLRRGGCRMSHLSLRILSRSGEAAIRADVLRRSFLSLSG
ncbi:hypothetical protein BSLA_02f0985 [Burkholderia stabilis]|nr:hypothetical protein BSLA_02f0985 [Burkholderia stabilis]